MYVMYLYRMHTHTGTVRTPLVTRKICFSSTSSTARSNVFVRSYRSIHPCRSLLAGHAHMLPISGRVEHVSWTALVSQSNIRQPTGSDVSFFGRDSAFRQLPLCWLHPVMVDVLPQWHGIVIPFCLADASFHSRGRAIFVVGHIFSTFHERGVF